MTRYEQRHTVKRRRRARAHRNERLQRGVNRLMLQAFRDESSPFSVWILDEHDRYLFFNRTHRRSMRDFWGATIEIGAHVPSLISDEAYRERMREAYEQARARNVVFPASVARDRRGRERYFHTILAPFTYRGATGGRGIVAFSVEVSELEHTRQSVDVLQRELDHRVQNNLQTIVSLLRIDLDSIGHGEARAPILMAIGRVSTLGIAYEMQATTHGANIDATSYLTQIVQSLRLTYDRDYRLTIETDFDSVICPAQHAVTMGLIAHELIALAMRYAAEAVRGKGERRAPRGRGDTRSTDTGPAYIGITLRRENDGRATFTVDRTSTDEIHPSALAVAHVLASQTGSTLVFVRDVPNRRSGYRLTTTLTEE